MNTLSVWGTVPQWISAGASCIALIIASIATRTWRLTLKGKRSDDLLVATFGLAGIVGSTIDAVTRGVSRSTYGAHVDRLFAGLLDVEKAYVVAMRSYKKLDEKLLRDICNMAGQTIYISGDLHDHQGVLIATSQQPSIVYYMNLREKVQEFRNSVRNILD